MAPGGGAMGGTAWCYCQKKRFHWELEDGASRYVSMNRRCGWSLSQVPGIHAGEDGGGRSHQSSPDPENLPQGETPLLLLMVMMMIHGIIG